MHGAIRCLPPAVTCASPTDAPPLLPPSLAACRPKKQAEEQGPWFVLGLFAGGSPLLAHLQLNPGDACTSHLLCQRRLPALLSLFGPPACSARAMGHAGTHSVLCDGTNGCSASGTQRQWPLEFVISGMTRFGHAICSLHRCAGTAGGPPAASRGCQGPISAGGGPRAACSLTLTLAASTVAGRHQIKSPLGSHPCHAAGGVARRQKPCLAPLSRELRRTPNTDGRCDNRGNDGKAEVLAGTNTQVERQGRQSGYITSYAAG